jgi:hypothetical protein
MYRSAGPRFAAEQSVFLGEVVYLTLPEARSAFGGAMANE